MGGAGRGRGIYPAGGGQVAKSAWSRHKCRGVRGRGSGIGLAPCALFIPLDQSWNGPARVQSDGCKQPAGAETRPTLPGLVGPITVSAFGWLRMRDPRPQARARPVFRQPVREPGATGRGGGAQQVSNKLIMLDLSRAIPKIIAFTVPRGYGISEPDEIVHGSCMKRCV